MFDLTKLKFDNIPRDIIIIYYYEYADFTIYCVKRTKPAKLALGIII